MAIAPTVKYFGSAPTAIILQTSDNFDGDDQTGDAVITPGLYTFPEQAGGGKFNYHEEPVKVLAIAYKGSGNLTVSKVFGNISGSPESVVTTVSPNGSYNSPINLVPGEYLKFTSVGAAGKIVEITSQMAYVPSLGS